MRLHMEVSKVLKLKVVWQCVATLSVITIM